MVFCAQRDLFGLTEGQFIITTYPQPEPEQENSARQIFLKLPCNEFVLSLSKIESDSFCELLFLTGCRRLKSTGPAFMQVLNIPNVTN